MSMIELPDASLCVRLAATIGHFLWQGVAVYLLVMLAGLLLRWSSAHARYVVFLAALLIMAACPLATFVLLRSPAAPAAVVGGQSPPYVSSDAAVLWAETPVTFPGGQSPPYLVESRLQAAPTAAETASLAVPDEPAAEAIDWWRYAPWLVAGYLGGTALMLVRLLVALCGGQRLRRRSEPVDDSVILAAFARQARALGLRFTPAIAFCRDVAVPTVVGAIRPMILLPLSAVSGLTTEQIEVLLAHELAHIRRYDHLVNILQRLIEAVLFFHPAVWFISRRIRIEREHFCDDLVLAVGGHRFVYAESLVRMAELSRGMQSPPYGATAAALGAVDRPSQLRLRILRLVSGSDREQVRLLRPAGFGLCAFLMLAAVACVHLASSRTNHHTSDAVPEVMVGTWFFENPMGDDEQMAVFLDGRVVVLYSNGHRDETRYTDGTIELAEYGNVKAKLMLLPDGRTLQTSAEGSGIAKLWQRIDAAPKTELLRPLTEPPAEPAATQPVLEPAVTQPAPGGDVGYGTSRDPATTDQAVKVSLGQSDMPQGGSQAWYLLRRPNCGPLLREMPLQLAKMNEPPVRASAVWEGHDGGVSLEIDVRLEDDAAGEILIGLFTDDKWSQAPVRVQKVTGAGRHTITGVPPGKYQVGAMIGDVLKPKALGVHRSWPQPVEVAAGRSKVVEVLVSPQFEHSLGQSYRHIAEACQPGREAEYPGSLVQGRVTDSNGKPVMHAIVQFREHVFGSRPKSIWAIDTGTDELGRYFLDKKDGPLTVSVAFDEPLPAILGWRSQFMRAPGVHYRKEEVNFALKPFPRGSASLRGRAVDENGQPVQGFVISVRQEVEVGEDEQANLVFTYRVPCWTPDGRFVVTDLPSGKHQIWGGAFDLGTYQFALTSDRDTDVELKDGQTTEVSVLIKRRVVLYARMLMEDGSVPPAAVEPPWPGGLIMLSSPVLPMFVGQVEPDGFAVVRLADLEYEKLKSNGGSLRINYPYGESSHKGGLRSIGKLSFSDLSPDRAKAGVVKIKYADLPEGKPADDKPPGSSSRPSASPPDRLGKTLNATVVIDAGHGGKDPGATGVSDVPEKTIVLDIARRLERALAGRVSRVIMTRSDDRFIELDQRAAVADREKADLFISIHADASSRPDPAGVSLRLATQGSYESYQIARSIEAAVGGVDILCNGVARNNYAVLTRHSRPGVMVGVGWLTNREDAARLKGGVYRQKMAEAIATGIVNALADRRAASADQSTSQPAADAEVVGIVRLPDGTPVAGAEVICCTKQQGAQIYDDELIYPKKPAKTNAEGRFKLPAQTGPFLLIVRHELGYGQVWGNELKASGEIRIRPWGGLKGTCRVGNKPGVRAPIEVTFRPGAPLLFVLLKYTAVTDERGEFDVGPVPPISGWIGRKITYKKLEHGEVSGESIGMPVDVKPGETAEVTLGGTGRPVVGRVALSPQAKLAIDLTWSMNSVNAVQGEIPYPSGLDNEARQAWYEKWSEREEGKAYRLARRGYCFTLDASGQFRVEDIPAGSYRLHIRVYEAPGDGTREFDKQIATLSHEFAVPAMPDGRSDEPLDLGVLDLKLDKEKPSALSRWEDAARFLFQGGSRDEAATRFQGVADDYPGSDFGATAAELAGLLRAMAREDSAFKVPDDPTGLDEKQRIAYLVFRLRDVAETAISVPGRCRVLFHPRTPDSPAVALRKLGKAAVPALMSLLDDRRPTRSIEDGFNGHHVLRYRDVALQIIEAIACRRFDSRTTRGAQLTNADAATQAEIVKGVRTWWRENEHKTEAEWIREGLGETGIRSFWSHIEAGERLIELEGPRSADFFRERLRAEPDDPWVIHLLQQAGGKAVLDDIRPKASHRDVYVRVQAYRALFEAGEHEVLRKATEDLGSALAGTNRETAEVLLDFLARCGDRAAIEAAAHVINHSKPEFAADAVKAFFNALTGENKPAPKLRPAVFREMAAALDNDKTKGMAAAWMITAAQLPIEYRWGPDVSRVETADAVARVKEWWTEEGASYVEELSRGMPATRPAAGGDEFPWGRAVDGLRCRWVRTGEATPVGGSPTLSVEVENSSQQEITWCCPDEIVWGVGWPDKSALTIGATMPKFRVTLGTGARVALEREVKRQFGVGRGPASRPDEPMPPYYVLQPGGRLTLTGQPAWKLPDADEHTVDCILFRYDPTGSKDRPTEQQLTCPPLKLQASRANNSGPAPATPETRPSGSAAEMIWGEPVDGLQAAVELLPAKEAYAYGEKIDVRFRVRNVSDGTIQLATATLRQDRAEIRDDGGTIREVPSKWYSGWARIVRHELKPGQDVTLESTGLGIVQEWQEVESPWRQTGVILKGKPGRHAIRYILPFPDVRREGPDGRVSVPQSTDWQGTLKTGWRELTVKPPDDAAERRTAAAEAVRLPDDLAWAFDPTPGLEIGVQESRLRFRLGTKTLNLDVVDDKARAAWSDGAKQNEVVGKVVRIDRPAPGGSGASTREPVLIDVVDGKPLTNDAASPLLDATRPSFVKGKLRFRGWGSASHRIDTHEGKLRIWEPDGRRMIESQGLRYGGSPPAPNTAPAARPDTRPTVIGSADERNEESPWVVEGRITDTTGKPVPGVEVVANCGFPSGWRTGSGTSGADGRYTLRFTAGVAFA